ncbi:hypothetical protein BLNAU_23209 [Blattamonas nauphoetae]|uniref:Uncharacterized protein n=1 Tax=Blattamonas nauphoetae TaxID=2049346 RepID=A0ABQ9WQW1_9EUKA|nr:hypothetical protein BLNAU_23209 [Blattamonas nauphoetae]
MLSLLWVALIFYVTSDQTFRQYFQQWKNRNNAVNRCLERCKFDLYGTNSEPSETNRQERISTELEILECKNQCQLDQYHTCIKDCAKTLEKGQVECDMRGEDRASSRTCYRQVQERYENCVLSECCAEQPHCQEYCYSKQDICIRQAHQHNDSSVATAAVLECRMDLEQNCLLSCQQQKDEECYQGCDVWFHLV